MGQVLNAVMARTPLVSPAKLVHILQCVGTFDVAFVGCCMESDLPRKMIQPCVGASRSIYEYKHRRLDYLAMSSEKQYSFNPNAVE